jgi:hypothetical protein
VEGITHEIVCEVQEEWYINLPLTAAVSFELSALEKELGSRLFFGFSSDVMDPESEFEVLPFGWISVDRIM